jgi:hypothetical protein
VTEKSPEKSDYEVKQEETEKKWSDPNFIKEKILDFITLQREKYVREYDVIHGEGAYEELHYMEPMEFPYEEDYMCDVLEEDFEMYSGDEYNDYDI